jgi:hypothetical protein
MHPLDHEQHICFRAVEMGAIELAYGYEKMWRYVFVPKVGMAGHDNHRMCDCCSIREFRTSVDMRHRAAREPVGADAAAQFSRQHLASIHAP